MANFNIDRIRFRWKNVWTVSTDYVKDDIVIHQGKAYVCLIGHESSGTTIYPDLNAVPAKWELMFDGNQWRGNWQADTLYYKGDIIKYHGYVYQCVLDHQSTNVVAQGPIQQIFNWTIVATTYNWLNTWTPSTSGEFPVSQYYNLGDVVIYNGITYICNEKHVATTDAAAGLEADQEKWDIVTRSDNWRGNWALETRYMVDDIVKYGAISYRCTAEHTSSDNEEDGLEVDQSKWEIFLEGIEYKGNWTSTYRYRKYDVVKDGGTLWKCTEGHLSTTSLRENQVRWEVYVPGFEYESVWASTTEYNKGDIVIYGGYSYVALEPNINSIPSVNDLLQDTGDWELLKQGYLWKADWSATEQYKTGDVVRHSGHLYVAIEDNTNTHPDTDVLIWQLLVDGRSWQNNWHDNTEYYLGDMVTYAGTLYRCIQRHVSTASDSRPDLDVQQDDQDYWVVLLQGKDTNVLQYLGDIRTHDGTETVRFAVGDPGNALKVNNSNALVWQDFEAVPNVFYVSVDGLDSPNNGRTLSAPFRTVKYACEYVQNNVDVDNDQSTIFIKTGLFDEQLPIKVPRNTALVGDELRGTVIMPASGFETSNMFYVNNGSGIRNMTLQGLSGILGTPNEYFTRRPNAGAYVSLDPGEGPDDESVWITTKSCYVQNVTTFGTACVGMKIDGALHNGGVKSVVANDFTQVLSDGIGYWATNGGRSELVSVFTYFCHIGYLAENGGILRATNGNNSYGTYGSVAEGFNEAEEPITATINNRTKEAETEILHTNGSHVLAFGYKNLGQNYTTAAATISGTGISADVVYEEFRNDAISNVRILGPEDSSIPGGLNYQYLLNNAQYGDTETITIAAADESGTAEKYVGMRIVITAGAGVGQYGVITGYDPLTKTANVSKEYNGTAGWEHLYPGYPIVGVLDGTTKYSIEPRVIIDSPTFLITDNSSISWPTGFTSSDVVGLNYVDSTWVAVNGQGNSVISTDGTTFTASQSNLAGNSSAVGENSSILSDAVLFLSNSTSQVFKYTPATSTWTTINLTVSADDQWAGLASETATNQTVAITETGEWCRFNSTGAVQSSGTFTNTSGAPWTSITYGNGNWVALKGDGTVAVSADGASWSETTNALGSVTTWNAISYGNGRYVAVGSEDSNAPTLVPMASYSFNGSLWYSSDGHIESLPGTHNNLTKLIYTNGEFLAITSQTPDNNYLAKSKDGWAWQWFDEASSAYLVNDGTTEINAVGTDGTNIWVTQGSGSSTIKVIRSGAVAFGRAVVESSRVNRVIMYDPGANYNNNPGIVFDDPEATIDALYEIYINDGVLTQPVFTNRGSGYITATATITGDGFAENYQTGRTLYLENVSRVPGPGANISIASITDDVTYRLTKVVSQSGSGPYSLEVSISPTIKDLESPDHGDDVIIREQYSQIRLTGHDFLDIGTGNVNSTRYPQLYLEGEDAENARQPFNETVENGGGRVFYTSTDQDGNFRVGELFAVEQATGAVTVNADVFELNGLEELSLGGIQVGGTAVVIREFSKDGTFIANSNNIVPTQAAIIKYLEARISGGGSDALTNTLIAGQVRVSGHNITTTSGLQINIPVLVNHAKGIGGDYLALQLFGI